MEHAAPNPDPSGCVAALDPGRSKCGLVRCDIHRRVIEAAVILNPAACRSTLEAWQQRHGLGEVVLGDGTGSRAWQRQLSELGLRVHRVDERGSTLAARQRYWELWPPRSWRRWIPQGLRLPPRDLDDVAAQLLLEQWLQRPLLRGPEALGA